MTNIKLKKLSLGNFLRLRNESGSTFSRIYDDLSSIHKYLMGHRGFFESTPKVDEYKDPSKEGIFADTLLVSKDVSEGRFFNGEKGRPKTILEALREVFDINGIEESTVDFKTSVKEKMGLKLFSSDKDSDEGSLDGRLDSLERNLNQVIADCFNLESSIGSPQDTSDYILSGESVQTQERSLKDIVMRLVNIHGGLTKLDHSDVGQVYNYEKSPSGELSSNKVLWTAPLMNSYVEDYSKLYEYVVGTDSKVEAQRFHVFIKSNTIAASSKIEVYVNGQNSGLSLSVAGNTDGSSIKDDIELRLNPGDRLSYKISTGASAIGAIEISKISLIVKEIS